MRNTVIRISLILANIVVSIQLNSQTIVNDSLVSGTWTLLGSPYQIERNIEIENDSTLVIEPGVTVEFQGHYQIKVLGALIARGTKSDTIKFTLNDTTGFYKRDTVLGGWNGIKFWDTPETNDSSVFEYCAFKYSKKNDFGGVFRIKNFSKLSIKNCAFNNNYSGSLGGVFHLYDSRLSIQNCVFADNYCSDSGGVIYSSYSKLNLINCSIYKNHSNNSGGVIKINGNSDDTIKIINNTIADNYAKYYGAVCYMDSCNVYFYNNIIYNNNTTYGNQLFKISGGNISFYYNNIEDGQSSVNGDILNYENNIATVPLFVDTADFNFNLDSTSACINAGIKDTSGLNIPKFDINGNTRIFNNGVDIIDIGAFEFQDFPTPRGLELSNDSINENSPIETFIGKFTAIHQDSTAICAYIFNPDSSDNDTSYFFIRNDSLFTSNNNLNFESSNTRKLYIKVTDENDKNNTFPLNITVNNVNEPPTNIFDALPLPYTEPSVEENSPDSVFIASFSSPDEDTGDAHKFSFTSGDGINDIDSNYFYFAGNNLYTSEELNYEFKSEYKIVIRSTDLGGLFYDKAIIVYALNTNDPPTGILFDLPLPYTEPSVEENSADSTFIALFHALDEDSGDTHTFSFTSGNGTNDIDSNYFYFSGSNLYTSEALNYEFKSEYKIVVRTTDSSGLVYDTAIVVNALNVNESVTGISLSNTEIEENSVNGTAIGNLSSTDVDLSDNHAYSFTSGNGVNDIDSAYFELDDTILRVAKNINYELKTEYKIVIRSTDLGGLYYDSAFTISTTDVNEAPTQITISGNQINENESIGSVVGSLSTLDEDSGDTHNYSFAVGNGLNDVDSNYFYLTGNNLYTSEILDYEFKPEYKIVIRSTDLDGLYYDSAFTISAIDINESPTQITISSNQINENESIGSVVGSLSTLDEDSGDTHSYSFAAGNGSNDVDSNYFYLAGNNLYTSEILDYELKPEYKIVIRTTDSSGLVYDTAIVVNALNVNEDVTGISLSNTEIEENSANGTAIGNLSSTDVDLSDNHAYSFTSGNGVNDIDSAYFELDDTILRVAKNINYELKTEYKIVIRSTDLGGLYYDSAFTINAIDINETPTQITISNNQINENESIGSVVGSLSTLDEDLGDTHSYSFVAGNGLNDVDSIYFEIEGNELKTKSVFNFEAKQEYKAVIRTTDIEGSYYDSAITISILDINEAPTYISSTLPFPYTKPSVEENSADSTFIASFYTSDEDTSDTHTFSFTSGNGTNDIDSNYFYFEGNNLYTSEKLDYEFKSEYKIVIRSTDLGELFYDTAIIVNALNVNESVTGISLSNAEIKENSIYGTAIGNLSSTDIDLSDNHTYSFTSGNGVNDIDSAYFELDDDILRVAENINYELKPEYKIVIRSKDLGGLYYDSAFTISAIDVNECPTQITISSNQINENESIGSIVGYFSTLDEDSSDTHSYSFAVCDSLNAADSAYFEIEGSTLCTSTPLNYEMQPTCKILVRTTDEEGLYFDSELVVAIANVNETPLDISISNNKISTNKAGAYVCSFTTYDEDFFDSHTYSIDGELNEHNKYFEIRNDSLFISKKLNVKQLEIIVKSTDLGGLSRTKQFLLTVEINFRNEDIKIYPNPATDYVNISIADSSKSIESLRIFNITGREQLFKNEINTTNHTLNLQKLSNGCYLMITKVNEYYYRNALIIAR